MRPSAPKAMPKVPPGPPARKIGGMWPWGPSFAVRHGSSKDNKISQIGLFLVPYASGGGIRVPQPIALPMGRPDAPVRGGLAGMACSHNSAAKCGKWVIIADIFPKLFYTRTALSVLLRRKHNENHHWLPSHAAKLSQTRSIGDTKREKMRTVVLYIMCPQRSQLRLPSDLMLSKNHIGTRGASNILYRMFLAPRSTVNSQRSCEISWLHSM